MEYINFNENYAIKKINEYNEINGYSIEEIIECLGYEFDKFSSNDKDTIIKYYKNANKSIGKLVLLNNDVPFFVKMQNDIITMIIVFKKNLQIAEFISIPETKLGVVEYGIDLAHPNYMQFYSQPKYDYKYSISRKKRKNVLPDEIKEIKSEEPICIINDVIIWASEIRRSLAPKNDIVIKK